MSVLSRWARRVGERRAPSRRLTPAIRGVAKGSLAWLALVQILILFDLSPSVPLLGAAALAVGALSRAARIQLPGESMQLWASADPATVTLGRGSDHLTTTLATHLARANSSVETKQAVAERLHERLRHTLEAAVWRTHSVNLGAHAEWASSLLPADLARLYAAAPDPDLLRPARLDEILRRIEQL